MKYRQIGNLSKFIEYVMHEYMFVCLGPKFRKRAERYDKPKYVTQSNVPKKILGFYQLGRGSNSCQFFASVLSLLGTYLGVQSLVIRSISDIRDES